MHEKTNNEYLPAYNAVRKVLPSSWTHVGSRSCVPASVQVFCTGTGLQAIHAALDYDSHHALAPRLARAMPGELGHGVLKATMVESSTAEMHITQSVSYIGIRLRISVHGKWALRLKILILYSQKCHRTKFLSSRKWRNWPVFWPSSRATGGYTSDFWFSPLKYIPINCMSK